jgi:hypothetical protein
MRALYRFGKRISIAFQRLRPWREILFRCQQLELVLNGCLTLPVISVIIAEDG